MEIDQLDAFVTLSKTKSFSRTAESLHVVQSTISMRIQVLEEQIGRPLFERTNRRVELTPAGRLLVPYAERILALARDATTKIRSQDVFEDKVTVGSTDSLWRDFIRPVLLDYVQKYPRTAVETQTSHSYAIVQALVDGVIQIGFVYHVPSIPGIVSDVFHDDDVILVAGKRAPYAKLRNVTKADLAKIPIVNIEWDGPLDRWVKKMLPRDFLPQVQLDQLSMLTVFVLEGRGAAFVPRKSIQKALEKGDAVELKLSREIRPPRRKAYVIYKKEKRLRPSITRWLTLLKSHYR